MESLGWREPRLAGVGTTRQTVFFAQAEGKHQERH
jgi:hypothetical protein